MKTKPEETLDVKVEGDDRDMHNSKIFFMAMCRAESTGPYVWYNGELADTEDAALNSLICGLDVREIRIVKLSVYTDPAV